MALMLRIAALAAACTAAASAAPNVLFALERLAGGGFAMQALFHGEDGQLRMPSVTDPETSCRAFPPEYTRPGRSYAVLFGGAPSGAATFGRGEGLAVSFAPGARLAAGEMGLATDGNGCWRSI